MENVEGGNKEISREEPKKRWRNEEGGKNEELKKEKGKANMLS